MKHFFKRDDRIVWPSDSDRASADLKHGSVEAVSGTGLALCVRWDDGELGMIRTADTALDPSAG